MTPSDWIAVVGIASGLAAFGAGLRQYAQAQRWKRAEFVADRVGRFEANPKVKMALQMLDWNSRTLELPTGTAGEIEKTTVDDALLAKALVHHSARPDGFDWPEPQIRDYFDELLDRLERFDHYIEAGLVTADDISPYLDYWLDILGNPDSGRKPKEFYESFDAYLTGYDFAGVRRLFGRTNKRLR